MSHGDWTTQDNSARDVGTCKDPYHPSGPHRHGEMPFVKYNIPKPIPGREIKLENQPGGKVRISWNGDETSLHLAVAGESLGVRLEPDEAKCVAILLLGGEPAPENTVAQG